jgi:formylglycine-generating enzyme required for sulfatase activity
VFVAILGAPFGALVLAQPRSATVVMTTSNGGNLQFTYSESHALIIGVKNYLPGWRTPLNGVEAEINELKPALEAHGFDVQVEWDLARSDLEGKIDAFIAAKGREPDGRVLIFFAGHGHTIKRANDRLGYVIPTDAPHPDRDMVGFRQKALPLDVLEAKARQVDSKHLLFVFDSCFSGALFEVTRGTPQHVRDRMSSPVRLFITAGKEDQEVPDRSVFGDYFVKALRDTSANGADKDQDGYVTGTELYEFLRTEVSEDRPTQTPQSGRSSAAGFDGDPVFILPRAVPVPVPTSAPLSAEAEEVLVRQMRVNSSGRLERRGDRKVTLRRYELRDGQVLEMIEVPAGSFTMGSGASAAEQPPHTVSVPAFQMSRYEITQRQWRAVARLPKVDVEISEDPSYYEGDDRPVDSISWEDAVEFTKRLSAHTGQTYRLPTEAEWEYACRASTTSRFHVGDTLVPDAARYASGGAAMRGGASEGTARVADVGPPNDFGLYGMHGNLSEWCLDGWHNDYSGAPGNAVAWEVPGDDQRVMRGGSWADGEERCRASSRLAVPAALAKTVFGLRVVMVPQP